MPYSKSLNSASEEKIAAFATEEIYTIKEAAKILSISIRTLRRWVDAGFIHAIQFGPCGRIRFAGTELHRVMGGKHE